MNKIRVESGMALSFECGIYLLVVLLIRAHITTGAYSIRLSTMLADFPITFQYPPHLGPQNEQAQYKTRCFLD